MYKYHTILWQRTEVDHWISLAAGLKAPQLAGVDRALAMATYLVGQSLTAADLAIYGAVSTLPADASAGLTHLRRWCALIESLGPVRKVLPATAKDKSRAPRASPPTTTGRKEVRWCFLLLFFFGLCAFFKPGAIAVEWAIIGTVPVVTR